MSTPDWGQGAKLAPLLTNQLRVVTSSLMNAPHEETHAQENDAKQAAKRAAVNGLAVVGFLALIFLGIMLAIYGARFVPDTISRLTSAVYLSSEPTNEPATTTNGGRPATTTVTVFVPVPATSRQ